MRTAGGGGRSCGASAEPEAVRWLILSSVTVSVSKLSLLAAAALTEDAAELTDDIVLA